LGGIFFQKLVWRKKETFDVGGGLKKKEKRGQERGREFPNI